MISYDNESMTQKRKILIFEDSYTLTEHLLKLWTEIAGKSVEQHNRFSVALSGGNSPVEFYCKLSALKDFDLWKRTHVFMGDERFVPLDHDRSNFRMIKENLLDYINIPPENVHPIQTNYRNVELAAEQYTNELVGFFEFRESKAPRFDLILLGIGPDGHTASLFADDPQVNEEGRIVLPVSLPHLKEDRISLALPVIKNARHVIMLALGANKAEIIREIFKTNNNLPASKAAPVKGQLIYLLDKDAARNLPVGDAFSHEGQAILLDDSKLNLD